MFKLLGVYGPFGPRGGMYVSCCINLYCIYHANNHGMYVSWCIHWYCIYSANNWGICISCWVSVGPSGPGGVCMSVAVYINIVYIMPTIRGCISVGVYIGLYTLNCMYKLMGLESTLYTLVLDIFCQKKCYISLLTVFVYFYV